MLRYVFFDMNSLLSVSEKTNRGTEQSIKSYVRDLYLAGKRLFCLTTEPFSYTYCDSFTYYNKVRFILENYPEIRSEDIFSVSKDSDKFTLIRNIASRDNIDLSECLLVEGNLTY